MGVLRRELVCECTKRKNQGDRGGFFKNLCRERDVIKRAKGRKTSTGSKHKFSRPLSVNMSKNLSVLNWVIGN